MVAPIWLYSMPALPSEREDEEVSGDSDISAGKIDTDIPLIGTSTVNRGGRASVLAVAEAGSSFLVTG